MLALDLPLLVLVFRKCFRSRELEILDPYSALVAAMG
jgi:hypothetical protein